VPETVEELEIVYGRLPARHGTLAVLTRSALQILLAMSQFVVPPDEATEDGEVRPSPDITPGTAPLTVRSGPLPPARSFVAVEFDGHHFWIEEDDFTSKLIFSFMQSLLGLAEQATEKPAPVLTIPAG
jgi:hypothetical protein